MDIKKLQTIVIDALEDVKAQNIKVYDTTKLTGLFDRLCFASGTSNRQTKALASSVREKVKENGGQVIGMEGEGTGEWVLVDLGDMVVHIMQPAIRDYYQLEELWGDHEVKLNSKRKTKSAVPSLRSPTKSTTKRTTKQATKRVVSSKTTSTSSDAAQAKPRTRKTATRSTSTAAEPKSSTPRKKATAKTTVAVKKASTSKRPAAKSKSSKSA